MCLRNEKCWRQREWSQGSTRVFLLAADLRLSLVFGALPAFGPGATDFFGWITNDEVCCQELLISLRWDTGDIADAQSREHTLFHPAHDGAPGDAQVIGDLLWAQKALVCLKSYLMHERLLGRKIELVQGKNG